MLKIYKKPNHFLTTLSLALSISACSTTPKTTSAGGLSQLAPSALGVALPIKLETTSFYGEEGCALLLHQDDSIRTFETDVKVGQDIYFVELPVGIYGIKEIFCNGKHWDLSFNRWPRFQVYPNTISFVSGLSIYLDQNGSMSSRLSNRGDNRDEALRLSGRLPVSAQSRVVSGYTGKPLLFQNLEKPARWVHWEILDGQGKDIRSKTAEWPTFEACYRGERDVNSLWLGNKVLKVTFENGDFSKDDTVDSWSSFTDHFSECLNGSIKHFHPKNKALITYILYI